MISAANIKNTIGRFTIGGITKTAGELLAGAGNYLKGTTQTAQDAFNQSQASAENAMRFSAEQAAQQMAFQKAMMENQQSYNSAEARNQRDWQEHMRATAYQATVKDMIAAGINPILAAQLGATSAGSGAQASSGMAQGAMGSSAQAQMQQQSVPDIIRSVGYLVGTAEEAANKLPETQMYKAKRAIYKWSANQINSRITPENAKGR